jgi:small subunit ribosomal protein S20
MPHIKQAKKRLRQNERRMEINRSRRSRVRTCIRRVEEAISGGDKTVAAEALRLAQPEIIRGANCGILTRNTAARRVSRLARQVNAMS